MSPASAPVENAYHVMSEVRYECHAGFVMKGGADSLKCHATGCWMPNELPTCVRYVQGLAERLRPGLVKFVTAVAYHYCLNLPAAFTKHLVEAFSPSSVPLRCS